MRTRTSSEEDLDNIDINALEKDASPPQTARSEFLDNHEMVLAREKMRLKQLKLVESKKRKRNIDQGTLAQVALSVVMEKDERSSSPSDWFDGKAFTNERRSSSLNEVNTSKDDEIEKHLENDIYLINRTGNENRNGAFISSDYKSKKAIGHTRSKSAGNSLLKSTKRQLSLKETTRVPITVVPESQSRLSSSLPENSGK
jgi:ribosomal protein L16 Arg81 hydroxylase